MAYNLFSTLFPKQDSDGNESLLAWINFILRMYYAEETGRAESCDSGTGFTRFQQKNNRKIRRRRPSTSKDGESIRSERLRRYSGRSLFLFLNLFDTRVSYYISQKKIKSFLWKIISRYFNKNPLARLLFIYSASQKTYQKHHVGWLIFQFSREVYLYAN